jgi:ABC-type polysaccharide/polyol phosphate transport system ATPase subunit
MNLMEMMAEGKSVAASEAIQDVKGGVESNVRVLVSHVAKMYRLFDRPVDLLKHQLFGKFGKGYGKEFWALRDVSFEVEAGEMFGVVGRNGSGKSTLLQIMAGILKPTAGQADIKGRVSALLELGSGFNPEYTGRDNVFMNGAISGLSRKEMEDRFDEIASFADIGDFIDRPVKTYSTGMLLRLAFSVSTNLDPDVLLIDEALAVGDIFFRQKCFKRLQKLLDGGGTIVLVSHSMGDVEQFCKNALVLQHGNMVFRGSASEAVKRYYLIEQEDRLISIVPKPNQALTESRSRSSGNEMSWPSEDALLDISGADQVANGWARCTAVGICNKGGDASRVFWQGETASFFYEFELLRDIEVPIGGVVIQSDKGIIVHGKSTLQYDCCVPSAVSRGTRLRFRQDIALEIAAGEYTFEVGLATLDRFHYERRSLYSHSDLSEPIMRLCHLPHVFRFAVVLRTGGDPVQLLHHGVANLPGSCQVSVVADLGP